MDFNKKKSYNVWDYIEWRGDLLFSEAPFNPVDNLVLSIIVYLDFSGFVDSSTDRSFRLADVMNEYPKFKEEKRRLKVMVPEQIRQFAKKTSECRRYANVHLMAYENVIDIEMYMQFAAVTFILDDGSVFVSCRGTDDTIVGWKEDFYIGVEPVAAQLYSTAYLERIAENYTGKLRIGGHSKGGNLAVWAAAHSDQDIQDRLLKIYSNDSPGFFNMSVLESENYKYIADRIESFVASDSIIGMLFDNDGKYKVVSSSQSSILQHNPFSWEVLGGDFVYLEERTEFGKKADIAVKKWLNSLSNEERQEFTEVLFSILESTNAKTLTSLRESKLHSIEAIAKSIKSLDKESRDFVFQTFKKLFDKD